MSSPTSDFTAALTQIDAIERSYNDGLALIAKLRVGLWKANEDQFTNQINDLDCMALHRPIDHANLALKMIDLSLNHGHQAEDKFLAALPTLYVADSESFVDPNYQAAADAVSQVGIRLSYVKWANQFGSYITDGDMEVILDFPYRAVGTIFDRCFRANGTVLLLLELYNQLPPLELAVEPDNRVANQLVRLLISQALISFGQYLIKQSIPEIRAQIPVLRNE